MDGPSWPLLVFDGDCGFCTSAAKWVARGWWKAADAVPWQLLGDQKLAEMGLSTTDVRDAAWWVDETGAVFRGHRAVGKALEACRGWKHVAGQFVLARGTGWLAAGVYRLVARYRHRLPGGTPACRSHPVDLS